MKIVVCVKLVPDSAARVVAENGVANWGEAPLVINPWDEYAVEAALLQKETYGGDVIALTVGAENAKEALKHALAMGCAEAILISDPALAQADSQMTAQALAAAIRKVGEVELAFFGRQAIDSDMGITAAQVARRLGWNSLTQVTAITALDPTAGKLQVERSLEEGRQVVAARLPAAVSVLKDFALPRYPSFMGIRKASRAPIPTWTLADLGLTACEALVSPPEMMNPPTRAVTTEMITGQTPRQIAETLVEKLLAEGVLA